MGIGIILMILALGVIGFVIYAYLQQMRGGGASSSVQESPSLATSALTVPPAKRAETEVRTAKLGGFLSIDGRQEHILGTAIFEELQFFEGHADDKVHVNPFTKERLREWRALMLAGDQILLEQPAAQGGANKFFLYQSRTDDLPPGFDEYMAGDDKKPGPARRFAQSKQQAEVTFDALGKSWTARDILWVDVRVEGGEFFVTPNAQNKPRLAMMLGKCGEEWILFADLWAGDGNPTLWVGRQFDPKVEIEV